MSTLKVAKVESPDTSTGGIAIDSGGDVQVATNFEVATIKDTSGNNSSTPEQINQGRAKAWIVFDGGSSSIGTGDDSFNVSGVTDNGTGDYTITFSTAMSSANYAVVGMVANTINNYSAEAGGSSRGAQGIHIKGTVAPTASAVRVESRIQASAVSNGANADFSSVHVAVFGD